MKKPLQIKHLAILAILCAVADSTNAAAINGSSPKVDGVYNLEGGREMAATLILHPDHRFDYGAIYGGADPRANGKWSIKNNIVHLVSDQRAPKYTKVEQDTGALPDISDSDGIRPALALVIATPSLGMRWGDVSVKFKFSNGRIRNGTTNESGLVYVGARLEPEWKDVPLTEVGLPLPEDSSKFYWIKVSHPKITRIAVDFDPGVMVQAFREGYLEMEEGKPRRLVAERSQGELRGTYVWQGPANSKSNP